MSLSTSPEEAKVLFVLTSCSQLGESGEKTGFHYEELATPYYILEDAGIRVDIASTEGGAAPVDPSSLPDKTEDRVASVRRFEEDAAAKAKTSHTVSISEVQPDEYAGLYLPGGHGTMWDFPMNDALNDAVSALYAAGKPVAAICHGVAGFIGASKPDGSPLVAGKHLNSFTDAEEKAIKQTEHMPFLLESRLRRLGCVFQSADNFTEKVVEDGNIITGQNPASAETLGLKLLAQVRHFTASQAA